MIMKKFITTMIMIGCSLALVSGCGTFNSSPEVTKAEQTCEENDKQFDCRIAQAYAAHATITDRVVSATFDEQVMSYDTAKKIVGSSEGSEACTLLVIDKPKCENLAGALLLIDQADDLGDLPTGNDSLSRANAILQLLQKLVPTEGEQL